MKLINQPLPFAYIRLLSLCPAFPRLLYLLLHLLIALLALLDACLYGLRGNVLTLAGKSNKYTFTLFKHLQI